MSGGPGGPAGPALRVAKVHVPVTALGPGRRVGVWLQGCSLHCPGCLSRDTWDPAGGTAAAAADLADRVLALLAADASLTGVTVSGGEPFEQPGGLRALLAGLRAGTAGRDPAVDLLAYSGLALARLRRAHGDILGLLDAVVPEPFLAARAPGGVWRGSANQPLVPLTALGGRRLAEVPAVRPFQVHVDADGVWMVGVPGPGDLDRLRAAAATRGVRLEDVSWQP